MVENVECIHWYSPGEMNGQVNCSGKLETKLGPLTEHIQNGYRNEMAKTTTNTQS